MRSSESAPVTVEMSSAKSVSSPAKRQGMEENIGSSNNKSHRGSSRLAISAAVVWLESIRVPKYLRRGTTTAETPLIAGLDRVIFGTQAACEAVTICEMHPPRYLCYMLSGSLCDLIQFFIDIFLHVALHFEDASLCWVLGFGLSISFRHTSHRYLVFGDYVGGYWQSLGRMYAGYSIIIVLSTIFNIVMTRQAGLSHYMAWVITLSWTGIVNYFIVKKLWSLGGKEKGRFDSQSGDVEHQEGHRSEGRLPSRKPDTSKQ